MLTIIAVVSLLAVESITVNAAELNLDNFPYKYYCNITLSNDYEYIVCISDKQLSSVTYSSATTATDLNTNLSYTLIRNQKYLGTGLGVYSANMYVLTYNSALGWEVHLPWYTSDKKYIAMGYTYTGFSTTVPSDMPDIVLDDLETTINGILNSTTNTYNEAISIQTTIENNYSEYKAGNIDTSTMQANLTQAINQLNDLNNNSSNTLADLMAIQNALTYAQTIQEELLLTSSSSVSQTVINLINQASAIVEAYQAGNKEQSTAMQELRAINYTLAGLITENSTIADIETINTGSNVVNNFIDILSNNSELDKTVSDKSQASDSDEIDFINGIETEMPIEDIVTEYAPSKIYLNDSATASENGTSSLTELFQAVWDNSLVKIIIPIFTGFALIALALGRKYKL